MSSPDGQLHMVAFLGCISTSLPLIRLAGWPTQIAERAAKLLSLKA